MAATDKSFEKRDLLLVAAALVLALGHLGLSRSGVERNAPWHEEKLAAARLAQQGMAAVKAEKRARGIAIDKGTDINETGLIGLRWSGMTTTLGVLEAKRTSTNPDFAAVAVELLKRCGAKPGDRIAVNLSASFPALNLSVLAAAQVMQLKTTAIASLGASMWGANDPEFNWLDIDHALRTRTPIQPVHTAYSLGGADDVGLDMDDEIREHLRNRIKASGHPWINESDFDKNIARRMALYLAEGTPDCFVNVGGNLASGGAEGDYGALKPGLIRSQEGAGTRTGGLIRAFLERRIPVVHLLDMKALALSHGLPYDPAPLPAPGSGGIYRIKEYPRALIALLLGVAAALVTAYVRIRKAR